MRIYEMLFLKSQEKKIKSEKAKKRLTFKI